MRKALILILSLFIGAFILKAQDTLKLRSALELGLKNNYQIQIAQKQLEIDNNNNTWGTAGLFPTISFNTVVSGIADQYVDPSLLAMAREELNDSSISVSSQQTLNIGPSVNLNWVIFNGFSVKINRSRLAGLQQLSEGNAALLVENALQSILLAYHLVILQQESYEVLDQLKQLSRDRYRYMLSKKEFGGAVTFDVLQAETNYLSDSANALRQEINYHNSLRNLNLVLAEPVEKEYVVVAENLDLEKQFELKDLIAKLESSNRTLQNQYINQEILRKNTRLSQSQLYPMVNLSAGLGRSYIGIYGDMERYLWDDREFRANATLNLSYTLSNGGNVRRAIQNAKIQEEIGSLQLEEMKQAMYNQLFTALEQYTIRHQLLQVANIGIESARLSLQIAEEKFNSGAINSFNYRDIQLAYLNAAQAKLQAEFNLIDSYTELLRLTGGIVTEFE